MRQLQEIKNDIEAIYKQIRDLNEKQKVLYKEMNERMFADFCEEYGVKSGDIVELNNSNHTQVQIVDMDCDYPNWVRCHKIKKNGEPYSNLTTQSVHLFDGCKIIKSMGE